MSQDEREIRVQKSEPCATLSPELIAAVRAEARIVIESELRQRKLDEARSLRRKAAQIENDLK